MSDGTGGLFLVGIPAFLIGILMMVKTRAMLQFRSPGNIEPGSIPRWKTRVWQGIGAALALLSIGLLSLSSIV